MPRLTRGMRPRVRTRNELTLCLARFATPSPSTRLHHPRLSDRTPCDTLVVGVRPQSACVAYPAAMNSQTMMVLSIEPEKNEFPGPRAMQRQTSECPTREARIPRLSKVGIIHNLSALSSQAVTSTEVSPCDVTSGTTIIDVTPEGALDWLVTSCEAYSVGRNETS